MVLDWSIDNPIASWLWLGGGVAWLIYRSLKIGIVPKQEHLKDPSDLPIVGFWNLFSPDKWTSEGIAFQKRVVGELALFLVGWVALFVVLDAIF